MTGSAASSHIHPHSPPEARPVVSPGRHHRERRPRLLGSADAPRQPIGVFRRGGGDRRTLRSNRAGPRKSQRGGSEKGRGAADLPLYAALCRSTPVFFVQDDHDYFENDEADDRFISFPPDAFMMSAGRASQHLYYPEFLPDPMRPLGLASASAPDRPAPRFRKLRHAPLRASR